MIKDAYSCQNGFSEYISMMEKSPGNRAVLISSWNADYKMLKHLRWLRNRIAHDTGCTELKSSDLDDLKDFTRRFRKSQDPLTAAEKLKKPQNSASSKKAGPSAGKKAASGTSEKKPFPWKSVIIGALVAIVLYLIIKNGGAF